MRQNSPYFCSVPLQSMQPWSDESGGSQGMESGTGVQESLRLFFWGLFLRISREKTRWFSGLTRLLHDFEYTLNPKLEVTVSLYRTFLQYPVFLAHHRFCLTTNKLFIIKSWKLKLHYTAVVKFSF